MLSIATVGPAYAPMEARSVERIPTGPDWQFEPKWDGFRCLAHRDGDTVGLTSKSGQPLARYFPEIVAALLRCDADHFSLDGELLAAEDGIFGFNVLQQRIHPAASRVAMLAKATPARYIVFDLLRADAIDAVEQPIEVRRPALERFLTERAKGIAELVLSPATDSFEQAQAWLDESGGATDGVVGKRLGVAYASGKRDAAIKIKRKRTADCVVGGFRYAKGSTTQVGSLLLGLFDENGQLDYVGFCSAFSADEKGRLLERLLPHSGPPGFTGGAPDTAPSRWSRNRDDHAYVQLRHELVIEVEFDQITGYRIRHGTRPVRWRTDKAPAACTIDQLAP